MATFFHLSKSLSSPLPFFRIPPPLRRKHRPSTVAPARAGPSSSSIAFAIGLPLSLLAVTVLASLRIANKLDQQFFEEMAMNEAIMQADEDDDDDYEDEDYYDDDDDDDDDVSNNHNPFFSLSSPSSSHGSLPMLYQNITQIGGNHYPLAHDLPQDDPLMNDDASSQSSLESFKYSHLHYLDASNEDNDHVSTLLTINNKCTRFCPREEVVEADFTNQFCNMRMDPCSRYHKPMVGHGFPRLTRIQSYVDVRRQQIQTSLVEEIHKRRMFKTVNAIENIGFQNPK